MYVTSLSPHFHCNRKSARSVMGGNSVCEIVLISQHCHCLILVADIEGGTQAEGV